MGRSGRWPGARGGLLLLALVPLPGIAQDGPPFYGRGAEGWFWYAPEPSDSEETAASPRPQTPAADPSEPRPLSAAWLRAHLDHYRQQAIDTPTPTQVALYLYLQRLALDKASRFSEVYQQVVQDDPYLDETTRRPVGTYGRLLDRVAGMARDTVLRDLATQAGLWFFYRSDCPYCAAQVPVLRILARQHGFPIQAIALDGRPLPDGAFPDARRDTGQAARLGVVSTPALFLVRPPDGIRPLAQGLLSLQDLEQRLLRTAQGAGWIDPEAHARTRPLVTRLTLAPEAAFPATVPDDPEAFLGLLRARARGDEPGP